MMMRWPTGKYELKSGFFFGSILAYASMTTINRNKITNWALVAAVIGLAGLLLWLAPEEQTLGSGIKSVYVHVALAWTALLGLIAAGLIGLTLALFS